MKVVKHIILSIYYNFIYKWTITKMVQTRTNVGILYVYHPNYSDMINLENF